MFNDIWIWVLPYLFLVTILRYITIKKDFSLIRIFTYNSDLHGAEAATFMAQLIGITWLILGLIFNNLVIQDDLLKFIIEEALFYLPIIIWFWVLSSRIKRL